MPPSISKTVNTLLGVYNDDTASNPITADTSIDQRTFWYGKEGNYGYPKFPKEKDVGGPMRLTGVVTKRQVCQVGKVWRGGATNASYTGGFMCNVTHTGAWSGEFSPNAWAAEAYRRMKPTKPEFSVGNFIWELRELTQSLRQRFLAFDLQTLGQTHLAYQFGWKPLMRDIWQLMHAQRALQARIKQLLRDNGKPVRRSIKLVETTEIVEDISGASYGTLVPVLVTQFYVTQPRFRKVTTNKERVWASARFRYWLPPGPLDVKWQKDMERKLLGLELTPSLIYNAIPWTWLLDWFTNVGSIIENMEVGVADRLAADYFYVMREKIWRVEQTSTGHFLRQNGDVVRFTGTSSSEATTKQRVKGDPFGFNTDQNSLTSMQWSILGALGLSRLR